MSEIEVRKMGIDDIGLLMEWRERVLRDVFEVDKSESLGELMFENRHFYEKHLSDSSHVACMAFLDGEPVGCGALCFYDEMPSPDNHSGKCAYLMNIYSDPNHRHKGIAKQVVEWLIAYAQDRGAGKIYLETTDAARELYASEGFVPMKDYMKLENKSGA